MPYIDSEKRRNFDEALNTLGGVLSNPNSDFTAGDLNYLLSSVVSVWLDNVRNEVRYQDLNDVLGALTGCKDEFVRNIVSPYERQKQAEHGDVWPNLNRRERRGGW